MINIAVTGCFSAGKSYVLAKLKARGELVNSADEYVFELYQNKLAQDKVIEITGLKHFKKKELAQIIYNKPKLRQQVENYIHPQILEAIFAFREENKEKKFIFTEIPLLFEAGMEQYFDRVICCYAEEKIRLKRAKNRGVTLDFFNKINLAQLTQDEKLSRSHYQLNSELPEDKLEQDLDKIIEDLCKLEK